MSSPSESPPGAVPSLSVASPSRPSLGGDSWPWVKLQPASTAIAYSGGRMRRIVQRPTAPRHPIRQWTRAGISRVTAALAQLTRGARRVDVDVQRLVTAAAEHAGPPRDET